MHLHHKQREEGKIRALQRTEEQLVKRAEKNFKQITLQIITAND